MTKKKTRTWLQWMMRHDLPEVLAIMAESDHGWSEDTLITMLMQPSCIGMVATDGDKVVGFMVYALHKGRLEILHLAVAKAFRHRGIGKQMVTKLLRGLARSRRAAVTLRVRETNLAAQLFFRSQGFRATKVLRGYYEDTGEDAILMSYTAG